MLYVADESTAALTKYSLVAGTWTANGTVGIDNDNYRGLAAVANGANVTIVATRNGQTLVRLDDASGYNGALTGAPTLLETAAVNTAYRGVAVAPGTACPEPAASAGSLAAASTRAACTCPSEGPAPSTRRCPASVSATLRVVRASRTTRSCSSSCLTD